MIRPKSKERAARMIALIAGDFVIGAGALAAVVEVRRHVGLAFTQTLLPVEKFALDFPALDLFAISLIAALALSGFYHSRVTPRTRPSLVTAAVIQTALVAIGGTVLVRPLPRTVLFAVPLVEIAVLPLWRRFLGGIAPIRARETVLVGDRDAAETLAGLELGSDERIRVTDSVTLDQLDDPATQTLLRNSEEVILVAPHADPHRRLELLRIRGARGFVMLASHVDALLASRTLGWIGDQPLVEVAASCGYGLSAAIKRAIDVAGALFLLTLSSPLWIVIRIAIRLDDGGPLFVRQERVGLGGASYRMWKFRSMRDSAGDDVDRITRVGALLRRYHVDELPQLINVLVGDMSLVGPRPERPELVTKILRDVPDFDLRSLVRPGIAGLAQVSAEYDTHPQVKLRYDLMYMCDWSVWLDFRLMLRAVSSSLAGTGR